MSESVVLPPLGESVTEGTVTRWLKQVGDAVEVDEPLLEVSTDKVDTEIPSPVAGILEEILIPEDETVEVGAVLARIGIGIGAGAAAAMLQPELETPAGPRSSPPAHAELIPEASPAPAWASAATSHAASPPAAAAVQSYLTPIVRKLAAERGVDLRTLAGTGVGGRIRREDVLAAAAHIADRPAAVPSAVPRAGVEVSPLRGTTEKMSRLRKVISERAVTSLSATAQLTTVVEVDVTRVARLRQAHKEEFFQQTGQKLSFLSFFVLAAAEALRSHPIINATVAGDSIVYPDTENISIAVDTERGLLTPVLRDAGERSLAQISHGISDLAERTRTKKITPDELSGGTFTLTNTGSRGALFDTPLVFLPQSAILGAGTVVRRPVVLPTPEGDTIAVRSTVYLALSYDHRIIDGADAARFLTQIKQRLEAGDFAADLGY